MSRTGQADRDNPVLIGGTERGMIVCSCNLLSEDVIRQCLNPGPECPRTPAQVYQCLGCSPQCGSCARTIRSIMAAVGVDPAPPAGRDRCTRGCCPKAAAVAHDAA